MYIFEIPSDSIKFDNVKIRLLDCSTEKEINRFGIKSRQVLDDVNNNPILQLYFETPEYFQIPNVKFEVTINCQRIYTDCFNLNSNSVVDLCQDAVTVWEETGNKYCEQINNNNTGYAFVEEEDRNKLCTGVSNRTIKKLDIEFCPVCEQLSWNPNVVSICQGTSTQFTVNAISNDNIEYSIDNINWSSNNIFISNQNITVYARLVTCPTTIISRNLTVLDCSPVINQCNNLAIDQIFVTQNNRIDYNISGTNLTQYTIQLKQNNIVLLQDTRFITEETSITGLNLANGDYTLVVTSPNCTNTSQATFNINYTSSAPSCIDFSITEVVYANEIGFQINWTDCTASGTPCNNGEGNIGNQMNWEVLNSFNVVVRSGSFQPGTYQISWNYNIPITQAGIYTIKLKGVNCIGEDTTTFEILESGDGGGGDDTNPLASVSPPVQGYWDNDNSRFATDLYHMDLVLTELNGSYTLKDNRALYFNANMYGAFNDKFVQGATYDKRYFIQFNDSYLNAYTKEELDAGINVDAYKGKEISVIMGYFRDGFNWYISGANQLVYIPGIGSTYNYNGGTYYNRIPSQIIDINDKSFRFNDYFTTNIIPNNKRVSIDALNIKEYNQKNTYEAVGIYSRRNLGNKRLGFVSDGWLEDLGHPCAYDCTNYLSWWNTFKTNNGGLNGAINRIVDQFMSQVVNIYKDYDYVMLNNELKGSPHNWDGEIWQAIKACYEAWYNNSTGILSAWLGSTVWLDPNKDKVKSWNNYNASLTVQQMFTNNNSNYVRFSSSTDAYWKLGVSSIGNYFIDVNNSIPQMITQALFHKQFRSRSSNVNQISVATIWNAVETVGSSNLFHMQFHLNRPLKTMVKAMVSGHLMFNYASAAAFFADGIHMWHDGYAIDLNSQFIYPAFNGNANWMDQLDSLGNPVQALGLYGTDIKTTYKREGNIDWLVNGIWAVYQHSQFVDQPIYFADVLDGVTWRTNENSFITGAWEDKKPFVAYKRVGGQYLIWACDFEARDIKDVQIRLKDSNNNLITRTIQLRADNASIILM